MIFDIGILEEVEKISGICFIVELIFPNIFSVSKM